MTDSKSRQSHSKCRPVTPEVCADIIIEMRTPEGKPGVVLISRKNPPYGWAIPGGFVDVGETVEKAAVREAFEETCLCIRNLRLMGVYSDPRRDPRGHTVSAVYTATASGKPRGADDAREARVFPIDHLPRPLAFDHGRILAEWKRARKL